MFFYAGVRVKILLLAAVLLVWPTYAAAGKSKPAANPQEKGKAVPEKIVTNIGKAFPEVKAETLEGKPQSVPGSARGKVTLVAVAFLRENQGQLDSWLNPFAEKFGKRDEFMFYEVPMISSGYKFMKFIIDGGMRGGLPDFKHKHVVTMYGDVEKYTAALQIDPRNGHAFLLDQSGIIRWQGEGYAGQEELKELFTVAEHLATK